MTSQSQVPTVERLNRNVGLLQAGSTVIIDIATPAGKRKKFRTFFVGYLPKDYVLVQFPDSKKLGSFSQYIQAGSSVTVRGLIEGHEGTIVAFVSKVRQTLQIPSRLLVLEFPNHVTLQSLRSNMRIDTKIAAKVAINKEYWQGTISDLSTNGCQVLVNNGDLLMMANDQVIEVIIEDFRGLNNLNLSGVICNVKKMGNDVSLGVKFIDSCQEQVHKLIQQVVFE